MVLVGIEKSSKILIACAAICLINSCSRPPILVLLNHSNGPVTVIWAVSTDRGVDVDSLPRASPDEAPQPVMIKYRNKKTIATGGGYSKTWTFELQIKDCELRYAVEGDGGLQAESIEGWPSLTDGIDHNDTLVQLEPGHFLFLVPADTKRVRKIGKLAALQPPPFPMQPLLVRCDNSSSE